MSGVWVFDKNGVVRLISNPTRESFEHKHPPVAGAGTATAPGARPRVLVYLPTGHVIGSFSELEQHLLQLGWSRYYHYDDHNHTMVQFHRSHSSPHLLSLPSNFQHFKPFHFYHIVLTNPSFFQVRLLSS